jgi:hypothetical protein
MYVFLLSDTCPAQVVCPGTYGGHLQGITTDESNAIYWSFTTDLVKTDLSGNLLVHVSVPTHHGDLTYHAGKLYVAVNLGAFNQEQGHAESWIYVYDAKALHLVSGHSIPEVVHGAGGLDYHRGRFFVVGGLPEGHTTNYVYAYDEAFSFVERHTVESGYTLKGIQTACHAQGYWWFGCYGEPPTLLKTDATFRLLGRYDFDCALGISGLSGDTLLIGRRHGEQRHGGQALPAKMHQTRGLVIVR